MSIDGLLFIYSFDKYLMNTFLKAYVLLGGTEELNPFSRSLYINGRWGETYINRKISNSSMCHGRSLKQGGMKMIWYLFLGWASRKTSLSKRPLSGDLSDKEMALSKMVQNGIWGKEIKGRNEAGVKSTSGIVRKDEVREVSKMQMIGGSQGHAEKCRFYSKHSGKLSKELSSLFM